MLCHYDECHMISVVMVSVIILRVFMLNAIMLSLIMLSVVMLSVIMPIVMALSIFRSIIATLPSLENASKMKSPLKWLQFKIILMLRALNLVMAL